MGSKEANLKYQQSEKGKLADQRRKDKQRAKRNAAKAVKRALRFYSRSVRRGSLSERTPSRIVKVYGIPTDEWVAISEEDRRTVEEQMAASSDSKQAAIVVNELRKALTEQTEPTGDRALTDATNLTELFSGARQLRRDPQGRLPDGKGSSTVKYTSRPICLLNDEEQKALTGLFYQVLKRNRYYWDVLSRSVFPWFLSLDPNGNENQWNKQLEAFCAKPVAVPQSFSVPTYPEGTSYHAIQDDRRKRARILISFVSDLSIAEPN